MILDSRLRGNDVIGSDFDVALELKIVKRYSLIVIQKLIALHG